MRKLGLLLAILILGLCSCGGGEASSSLSSSETSTPISSTVPWSLSSISSIREEGEEGAYYVIRGCLTYKFGNSLFLQEGRDAIEVVIGSHTSLVSDLSLGKTLVVSGQYGILEGGVGYERGLNANLSEVTCAVAEIPLGDEVTYETIEEPDDLLANHGSMVRLPLNVDGEDAISYKGKEIVLEGDLPTLGVGEEYTYQGPCLARRVDEVTHLRVLEASLIANKA